MKEDKWILIFSIVIILIGLLAVLLFSYPIFDVRPQLVKKIPVELNQMDFYYVEGNATMQDCIQVKLIDKRKRIVFSKIYEGYNCLIDASKSNDTVRFVLKDTSLCYMLKQDTFLLTKNSWSETH